MKRLAILLLLMVITISKVWQSPIFSLAATKSSRLLLASHNRTGNPYDPTVNDVEAVFHVDNRPAITIPAFGTVKFGACALPQ